MILQPIDLLYTDNYYSSRNLNLSQRDATQLNSNLESTQNEVFDIIDLSQEAQQLLFGNKSN